MNPTLPPSLFETLRAYRLMLARKLEIVSDSALDFIPPGEANSARWNMAHLITTPFLLTYARVGATLPLLPAPFVNASRKGSRPEGMTDAALFSRSALSRFLFASLDQIKGDYRSLSGRPFTPYETSTGQVLADLDGALTYALLHEGHHSAIFQSRLRHAEVHHV